MADMTDGPGWAAPTAGPRALRAPERYGAAAAGGHRRPAAPYARYAPDDPVAVPALSARLGRLTQFTGAIVSVALLIGMGVWGYRLVVRDVSGVPVVSAAQTAMREAPVDPGGNLTLNTGLAVNAIAAAGIPEAPEDRLMLAPATSDLTAEDLLVMPTAEADEMLPEGVGIDAGVFDAALPETPSLETPALAVPDAVATAPAADQPLSLDDITALADQIAAGAAPLGALSDGTDVPVTVTLDGAVGSGTPVIATSIPGVTRALRPPARPVSLVVSAAPVSVPVPVPGAPVAPAAPVAIPANATLVQLGAFNTAEEAAAEWETLSGRFAEFMSGKQRVVQEASSGERRFFRLRAMGFDDFDDAGRFCAALVAENALCIPVAGG